MRNGFIVEGVVGSGKTTLLSGVQRRLAEQYPSCTKFFVSEHYTDRIFEDERHAGPVDMRAVLAHTAEIIEILVRLGEMKRTSKFANARANAATPMFLERWIGSHVAHMRTREGRWTGALDADVMEQITQQYETLFQRGLGVIVLRVDPDDIENRLRRTLTDRNAGWGDYIDALGGLSAATRFFAEWQDHLLAFYDHLHFEPKVISAVEPATVGPIAQGIVNEIMGGILAA